MDVAREGDTYGPCLDIVAVLVTVETLNKDTKQNFVNHLPLLSIYLHRWQKPQCNHGGFFCFSRPDNL